VELSLDFSGCVKITDKGLRYLAKGLEGKAPLLECLHLNFSYNSKVTNEGTKQIALCLMSFPSIQYILLEFFCGRITKKTFSFFTFQFKELRSLKSFQISLDSCIFHFPPKPELIKAGCCDIY
jgi:hypothetical protein